MKTPEEILSEYIFDTDSIDGLSYDDAITCMNELAAIRVIEFNKWRSEQPNQINLLPMLNQYELFLNLNGQKLVVKPAMYGYYKCFKCGSITHNGMMCNCGII